MLKLQYFGDLMRRANSLEKILMPGKTEGRRRRQWQRMRWLDSINDSMNMNLSKLRETVEDSGAGKTEESGVLQSWGLQRAGYDLVIEQQHSFTTIQCQLIGFAVPRARGSETGSATTVGSSRLNRQLVYNKVCRTLESTNLILSFTLFHLPGFTLPFHPFYLRILTFCTG